VWFEEMPVKVKKVKELEVAMPSIRREVVTKPKSGVIVNVWFAPRETVVTPLGEIAPLAPAVAVIAKVLVAVVVPVLVAGAK